MATNSELVMMIDRGLQALNELKGHATQLAQLEQAVKAKQDELSALESKIAEAKGLAGQVDQIQQVVRSKQRELAELQAEISRKHEMHGQADSVLRDLRKRISGDPTQV